MSLTLLPIKSQFLHSTVISHLICVRNWVGTEGTVGRKSGTVPAHSVGGTQI